AVDAQISMLGNRVDSLESAVANAAAHGGHGDGSTGDLQGDVDDAVVSEESDPNDTGTAADATLDDAIAANDGDSNEDPDDGKRVEAVAGTGRRLSDGGGGGEPGHDAGGVGD